MTTESERDPGSPNAGPRCAHGSLRARALLLLALAGPGLGCGELSGAGGVAHGPAGEPGAGSPGESGSESRSASQSRSAGPTLAVDALRTEHAAEPLALETRVPRFSWVLVALERERRGLGQSGYRILVARSPEALAREEGELWDSGRVESSETVDVPYGGAPLTAFEHAFWRVRVFDRAGTPSGWSAPAHFAMGALAPSDWSARWIGYDAPLDAPRLEPDLGGARWLCAPDRGGTLWLRCRFDVPDPEGRRAVVLVAGADEYELFLNGTPVGGRARRAGQVRDADLVHLTTGLVSGENLLAARVRSADGPAALIAKLLVGRPDDRTALQEIVSDAGWRASASGPSGFERPGFDDANWPAASELGDEEVEALGPLDTPTVRLPPPRLLRGTFQVRPGLRRATLAASALGTYSLELNGARVGEDWFAPGLVDYRQRIPYRAYDVSGLVHPGENALGAVLADGWYSGFFGKRGKRDNFGTHTRFLGQLVLEYADGSRELVGTGPDWHARTGPWLEADLYMGERYDARLELPGWSAPGFEERGWHPVDTGAETEAPLVAHDGAEVRVLEELSPRSVTALAPGHWVFDVGQNLAGVARIDLEAPAGTAVVLRFGEHLAPDGSVYRGNLTWARARDLYHARGGGRERWQPRFTYHGFRYVEVSGLSQGAPAPDLTILALSSATHDVGSLRCSDERLERLVEAARWTLRANSMDVPTDCPQRGERLGWTGDAQLFLPSALWLADQQALYTKWSRDLLEAQLADGDFPSIAPGWETLGPGGPAWSDAGVLVPERLWRVYGDRRLVERQLPSMRRFLDLRLRQAGPEVRAPEAFESFGDWGALGAETSPQLLWLAYLARDLRVMAGLERELGNPAEAGRRQEEHARVVAAFERDFLGSKESLAGATQTALALALREGLLPAEERAAAVESLQGALDRNGIATGFVGTAELLPALSENGRADEAWTLLAARDHPSWGYMLDQGATTLWERWDAVGPEGLARGGRVSLSHTPLGACVDWLFASAAGIQPAEPGFRAVRLAPLPGTTLDWLEARYASVRGTVALRWTWAPEGLEVAVEVPPNVEATLALEVPEGRSLLEGGRPLEEVQGVRVLGRLGGTVLLGLESGPYDFSVPGAERAHRR